MNMKLISRDFYLRQLEAVRDIPDIKVITGIRRCGKSSLMDAFSARIAGEAGVNVVRINLNLKRNIELRQPESLYEYVESRYRKDLKNYLSSMKCRCVRVLRRSSAASTKRAYMTSTLPAPMHSCYRAIWPRFLAAVCLK